MKYVVELPAPETGWRDIQALAARSRKASKELCAGGARVRFLRSVLVPDDGTCFLVYEADSKEAVSEAVAHATLRPVRIAEAMQLAQMDEERPS